MLIFLLQHPRMHDYTTFINTYTVSFVSAAPAFYL